MKTLILYASKYGATREIAQRIAKKMDGAVLCDLKERDIPPLTEFDRVICGAPLYAGSIRKEAKTFLAKNADELSAKKLGLFLSGFAADDSENYFEKNFPEKLVRAAKAKELLGGIFDPRKASAPERFIIKIVMKQTGYIERINDENIAKFVEDLK